MANIRLNTIIPDVISGSTINLPGTLSVTSLISASTTETVSISSGSATILGGIGISKSAYIGGSLKFAATSISTISIDTSIASDTGTLVLSGSNGVDYTRGASIQLNGIDSNNGSAQLTIGNGGSFTITSGNINSTIFNPSGSVSFVNTNGSTSSNSGAIIVSGGIGVSSTSDATSSTNGGGITVAGGIACAKKMFVGGNLAIIGTTSLTGVVTVSNTTNSTSSVTGSMLLAGGIGISKDAYINGNSNIGGNLLTTGILTIVSTSDTSFITGGGLSVAKGLSISGIITSTNNITTTGVLTNTNTIDSTSINNGSVVLSGGIGISKTLRVGGALYVSGLGNISGALSVGGILSLSDATDSTAVGNGSLILSGGLSVAKTLRVGESLFVTGTSTLSNVLTVNNTVSISGITNITNATQSVNNTTGALVVNGGIGISGGINALGVLNTTNTTDSTSVSTGSGIFSGGIAIAKSTYIGGALNVSGSVTFANTISVTGNSTIAGTLSLTNTTNSTSTTSGAVLLSGGIGIVGNIYTGGNVSVSGTCDFNNNITTTGISYFTNTLDSSGLSTASLVLSGGASVAKNVRVFGSLFVSNISNLQGVVNMLDTTDSTSSVTGSSIISGGIGVSKSAYIGGTLNVSGICSFTSATTVYGITTLSNTTNSTSSSSGSLIVSGGIGIMKDAYVNGIVDIAGAVTISSTFSSSGISTFTNTTDSGSFSTGSVVINGGIGIAKKLHCNGNAVFAGSSTFSNTVNFTSVVDSSSISTGSVTITGGIGVTRNAFIGGNVDIAGTCHIAGNISNDSGIFTLGDVTITDSSGLLLIESVVPTLRIAATVATSSTVYSNSLDIFSLGRSYTDLNHESLQFSTTGTTGFTIMTRRSGTGVSRSLFLQSTSTNTGQLTLDTVGNVIVAGTVDSTDLSSGIFRVAGGMSVAKNVSIGGSLKVFGNVSGSVSFTATSTTLSNYSLVLPDSLPAGNNYALVSSSTGTLSWSLMQQNVFTNIIVTDTTDSTSVSTGSITTAGGVGISKSLFVGTGIYTNSHLNMLSNSYILFGTNQGSPTVTSRSTGTKVILSPGISATTVDYAMGVATNDLWLSVPNASGNNFKFYMQTNNVFQIDDSTVSIFHTTESSSTNSGSLVVYGGLGVSKNTFFGSSLSVSGIVSCTNTTDSTSLITGSLVSSGGIAVSKSLSIGKFLRLFGATSGNISIEAPATVSTSYSLTLPDSLPVQSSTMIVSSTGVVSFTSSVDSVNGIFETLSVTGTSESTTLGVGSLQVSGGTSVAKNISIGGALNFTCSSSGSVSLVVPPTSNDSPTYTLPAEYPSSDGMVLTSDTSGNFTWTSGTQTNSNTFTASNNVSIETAVTNMIYTEMTKVDVLVSISRTSNSLSAKYTLHIFPDTDGNMTIYQNYVGADTGVAFSVNTTTGQVLYTSTNMSNFLNSIFTWSSPELPSSPSGGFPQSFYASNNISTATNIPNFIISGTHFLIYVTITNGYTNTVNNTKTLLTFQGVYQEGTGTWTSSQTIVGPSTGVSLSVLADGQVQYTTTNLSNWSYTLLQFSRETNPLYSSVSFESVSIIKNFYRGFSYNPTATWTGTSALASATFVALDVSDYTVATWLPYVASITWSGTNITIPYSGLWSVSLNTNSNSGLTASRFCLNTASVGNGASTSVTNNTNSANYILSTSPLSSSSYSSTSTTLALNSGTIITPYVYSSTTESTNTITLTITLIQYLS